MAIIRDLDGYTWHLLELHGSGHSVPERLAAVQLHVACLARSLEWYQSVLGMRVLRRHESTLPGSGRHTATALVGFSEELEGTLLELRQAGDAAQPAAAAAAGAAGRAGVSHFMIESEQELAVTAAGLGVRSTWRQALRAAPHRDPPIAQIIADPGPLSGL